jgi:hypothetical protein
MDVSILSLPHQHVDGPFSIGTTGFIYHIGRQERCCYDCDVGHIGHPHCGRPCPTGYQIRGSPQACYYRRPPHLHHNSRLFLAQVLDYVDPLQIFAICFSVTSFVLASDGLGVFGALTIKRANALMKAYYASNFLYVLTIGSAKISLVTFFYSAQCQPKQRRYIVGFGIFLLAWTLVSVIAVAFQCDLPRPWEVFALHCYNRVSYR